MSSPSPLQCLPRLTFLDTTFRTGSLCSGSQWNSVVHPCSSKDAACTRQCPTNKRGKTEVMEIKAIASACSSLELQSLCASFASNQAHPKAAIQRAVTQIKGERLHARHKGSQKPSLTPHVDAGVP
jgi:hypothetical protein